MVKRGIKVELELDVKESGLITIFCINATNKEESWPLYFNLNSKKINKDDSNVKVVKLDSQLNSNCFDMVDSIYGKSKNEDLTKS